MSKINDSIVAEYFESLGFIVNRPCKYVIPGRAKTPDEEMALLVVNPLAPENRIPGTVLWGNAEVQCISRGVVAVMGWHCERFYQSMFEKVPELLRFTGESVSRSVEKRLGTRDFAKIICLADLPASREHREKTLASLRQKGVDGVILFKTVLDHLVNIVDTNRNYEKSDVLQVLRILKSHKLLKDDQLELFQKKNRRRRSSRPAGESPPTPAPPGQP